MARTLVCGAATGYGIEDLKPFLRSLRQSGYTGDVCLLVERCSPELERFCRDLGVAAVPIARYPRWRRFVRRSARSLLLRLDLVPIGRQLGRWIPLPARMRAAGDRCSAALLFHVSSSRYFLYEQWIRTRLDQYDRIILSDVRDVVFQADPSHPALPGELCVFLESDRVTIGAQPYNRDWITQLYGSEVCARLAEHPVSCSGVTVGTGPAILRYLETMTAELLCHAGAVCNAGLDQGVHNYLLWTGRLPDAVVVHNGCGLVLTVGIETPEALREAADGNLLNFDGSRPAIVHQYDRLPGQHARIQAKYSA